MEGRVGKGGGEQGWGEGEGRGEKKRVETIKLENKRIREEGAIIPFYSESGTPSCCQVTVERSLEEMLYWVHPKSSESGLPGLHTPHSHLPLA